MASNYGIIGFVKPPTLSSVTKAALVKFKEEYEVYKEKCADVNKSRPLDGKIVIASIRDCIDGQMLYALVKMRKIEGAETVEQASPKKVEKWFRKMLDYSPQDMSERIDAVLSTVTYTKIRGDPPGSALTFCIDFMKSLSTNVAESVLLDIDQAIKFIDRLVDKLGASCKVLRERMKMRREGWTKKERGDFNKFETELANLAIDVHQNEIALKRSANTQKPSKSNKTEPLATGRSESDKGVRKHNLQNKPKSRKRKKSDSEEWTEKCLNPNCEKIHMLRDCENTTPEEKKILFKKRWEQKKKNKKENEPKVQKAKSVKNNSISDIVMHDPQHRDDGRYNILIEDVVQDVILGDYGSDLNAMPNSTFKKVLSAVDDINVEKFDVPVKLDGAFKTDKDTFTASKLATLTITMLLPGSNIRVRLRGIKFHIVDQEMDETLLSRSLLQSMGFNLNDHLERVHSFINNKHVDDLDPTEIKAASLKYQGLSYDDADDDPITLPESLSAGIGEDSRESIDKAFNVIAKDARAEGISSGGAQRLTDLLEKYRDVFRIKLSADPPAKVPPLVITRSDSAKPYRSPQRRYAPTQRDFIVRTIRELEQVGAIYKNNAARWASPALAVPKPGSTKMRFTVDLRGPNARTVPIQSAMPHLESHFQDISGSMCFANIDLAHGYN